MPEDLVNLDFATEKEEFFIALERPQAWIRRIFNCGLAHASSLAAVADACEKWV